MSATFDTSAPVKLVQREPESGAVGRAWNATADAHLSTIGSAEIHAAVARAHRDGRITASAIVRAGADLGAVWRQVVTVDVDAAVAPEAAALAGRHGLAARRPPEVA